MNIFIRKSLRWLKKTQDILNDIVLNIKKSCIQTNETFEYTPIPHMKRIEETFFNDSWGCFSDNNIPEETTPRVVETTPRVVETLKEKIDKIIYSF